MYFSFGKVFNGTMYEYIWGDYGYCIIFDFDGTTPVGRGKGIGVSPNLNI